jgi:hypothetical protein
MLLSARCYKLNALKLHGRSKQALLESNMLRIKLGLHPVASSILGRSYALEQHEGAQPSEKDIPEALPNLGM